jgi:hypothetical protein
VRTSSGVSGGSIWTKDRNPLERRLVGIRGETGENSQTGGAFLLNHEVAAFLRKHRVRNKRLEAADQPY